MSRRLKLKTIEHLSKRIGIAEKELVYLSKSLKSDPRKHYHSWSEPKPGGGSRQLTAPSERLKYIQRRINSMLQKIDLPDIVYGSRKGRSAIDNGRVHRFAKQLVQTDIRGFFPSVTSGRVCDMFKTQQDCSPDVARMLTRLVTVYGKLPQGAPTSPIVAALVTVPMTDRIQRLATIRNGVASIYVDDVTVSGVRQPHAVLKKMAQIISSEGFRPHPDKTEVRSDTSQLEITGVRVRNGSIDAPDDFCDEIQSAIESVRGCDRRDPAIASNLNSIQGQLNQLHRLNPHKAQKLKTSLNDALL